MLVLEGIMVITVLTLVVIGNQLSPTVIYFGVSPINAAILLVWLAGIYMIEKAITNYPGINWVNLLIVRKKIGGTARRRSMIRP